MTDDEPTTNLRTYELRVRGSLGPLLLSAIPHATVARVPEHTLLVTNSSDNKDLLDIVRLMVAVGVEVESVRTSERRPPAAVNREREADQAVLDQPDRRPEGQRC